MNKIFFITSFNSTIKITCPISIFKKIIKSEFTYSYIPMIMIHDSEKYKVDCEMVVMLDSDMITVDYPKSTYCSHDPQITDIITLAEYLLERARQEKGVFCIHSSTTIFKNKAIVFWGGATGMGKTSCALKLSENKDSSFFSDEKTLIDLSEKCVVGGINKLYISKNYLQKKFPNQNFETIVKHEIQKYPISCMIYPFVSKSNFLIFEEWDRNTHVWHLYEELARKIRGTSRRFFNGNYPIDSIDAFELSKRRINLVKNFCDFIPNYVIRSNPQKIAMKISRILSTKNE